jgi:DNA polymerase-3 subunit epsilon
MVKENLDEVVILDFETTGLSPAYARIIEVGAVVVKGEKVIDTVSQLMHPGCYIPGFITDITGITNQMVKGKPIPEKFMPTLYKFIGNRPILAHNAAFDQKFLVAEMENIGKKIVNPFLCTLKLARRLIVAPDYKLTTLTSHLKLKVSKSHQAHRALDDVMATLQVWLHIKKQVSERTKTKPDFNFFTKLEKQPKGKISKLFEQIV